VLKEGPRCPERFVPEPQISNTQYFLHTQRTRKTAGCRLVRVSIFGPAACHVSVIILQQITLFVHGVERQRRGIIGCMNAPKLRFDGSVPATPLRPRKTGKPSAFFLAKIAILTGSLLLSPLTGQAQEPLPAASVRPAAWDKLKAAHDYQKPADFAVTEKPLDDTDFLRLHLTFKNAKGQSVTGLFVRPKADGVYPVALVLHGLRSSKEEMFQYVGRDLVKRGIACLLLDAELHGERREPGTQPGAGPIFLQILKTTVGDYRLVLDYLTTRKDIDPKRIGLLGYSMGAMTGGILAGVEERVSASALCVGGDLIQPLLAQMPESFRPVAEAVAPANYVGHISPRPVLFINAKDDRMISTEAAERLQKAAKEPKTVLTVEGGHIIPLADLQKTFDWLAEKVKATATTEPKSERP
jgi:uncharacterized protein